MGDPYAPTDDWREGYSAGYESGRYDALKELGIGKPANPLGLRSPRSQKKRKPTAYNNFVSKKSQLPRFKYKSTRGKKKKGMTNLKAIGVAWRKLSKNEQAKFK